MSNQHQMVILDQDEILNDSKPNPVQNHIDPNSNSNLILPVNQNININKYISSLVNINTDPTNLMYIAV